MNEQQLDSKIAAAFIVVLFLSIAVYFILKELEKKRASHRDQLAPIKPSWYTYDLRKLERERDEQMRLDIAAKVFVPKSEDYLPKDAARKAIEYADALIDYWKANPRKQEEPIARPITSGPEDMEERS